MQNQDSDHFSFEQDRPSKEKFIEDKKHFGYSRHGLMTFRATGVAGIL